MDKQQNKAKAQKAKQQNQQAGQGQYGAEFASETDAQQVRQQNAQAQQHKGQGNQQ